MASLKQLFCKCRQCVAFCIIAAISSAVLLAAGEPVSAPMVSGPIRAINPPGTDATHNYPQLASEPNFSLSHRGYVEVEYFLEGHASRYETPLLATGVLISSGHPYKTRILVRRPSDPANFNGVVIVEWTNPAGGYSSDLLWQATREYLTQAGYAYVAVSVDRTSVNQPPDGLVAWSPTRYGSLDVTVSGTINDNSLAYDIFSQAGEAIRTRPEILGGLRPKILIAVGQSYSASRLANYYNSIQPLHGVYDGFLLHTATDAGPFRADIGAKLMRINTENEVVNQIRAGTRAKLRQPDSSVFRHWEIAGGSHLTYQHMMYLSELQARDGLQSRSLFGCDRQPFSHVDNRYVVDAGYYHLQKWIRDGQGPPSASPIEVNADGSIPRDKHGIARGGIRLASVDVPTATNTGENSGPGFCRLFGSHAPFSATELSSLYPNHRGYVAAVKAVTMRNVKDGFILKSDAEKIIRNAEQSPVGTSDPLPIP